MLVSSRNTAGRARSRSAASTRVPDTVAPTAPVFGAPLRAMQVGTGYHVAWHATDVGSGVASYTVHVRTAGPSGGFGRARAAAASTPSTSIAVHASSGNDGSATARRLATAWATSAPGARRGAPPCPWTTPSSTPRQDGGGRQHGQPGAYDGTILETCSNGSRTTTGAIAARRLGLIVTDCRACGHIAVYWNGTQVGEYDLSASRTSMRRRSGCPRSRGSSGTPGRPRRS